MGSQPVIRQSAHGVPTAEQEALQAPAIDPIQTLVNLPVFGLMPTVNTLAMSALLNRNPQVPMTNKAADGIQNGIAKWGQRLIDGDAQKMAQRGSSSEYIANETAKQMGSLKNATTNELPDLKGWLKDLSNPQEWRDLFEIIKSGE